MKKIQLIGATISSFACLYFSPSEALASVDNNHNAEQMLKVLQERLEDNTNGIMEEKGFENNVPLYNQVKDDDSNIVRKAKLSAQQKAEQKGSLSRESVYKQGDSDKITRDELVDDVLKQKAKKEMADFLGKHTGTSGFKLIIVRLKSNNQFTYDEKIQHLIGYGAAINESSLSDNVKNELIETMCLVFDRHRSSLDVEKELDNDVKQDGIKRVYVSKISVVGAELVTGKKAGVNDILAKYSKRKLSKNEFDEVIARLNSHFRSKGYPAATCYFPEQENPNNEIVVKVELGKIGRIILENSSNISDKLAYRLLAGIKHGEIARSNRIETAIYNINEIGGIQAAGFLRPGENLGETDIVVRIRKTTQDNYMVTTDNYGNKSSGKYHYGIMGEWINKFNNGERIAASGSTSNQRQRNYGISYEQYVSKNGTKALVEISSGNYELGSIYSSLGVVGRTRSYGISFRTPLWKKGTSRLGLNYGFVHREMKDEMRSLDYLIKKHSDSAYLSINGSELFGKAAIKYDFTVSHGKLACDSAHILGYPLNIAGQGRYTKSILSVSSRYRFNNKLDLLVKGNIQNASNLLDSSEQLYLGGAKGVRAYPQGEGSGDEGYLASAELIYHTGIKGLSVSAFYDKGYVKYAKDNSVLGGVSLSGWGAAIAYSNETCWARLDYARRIGLGENVSQAAHAKGRIWVTAGIRF